jgi:hypothetical protein
VVQDTDSATSGSEASNIRESVDFPAPDGEESTNNSPRRSSFAGIWVSLSAIAATARKRSEPSSLLKS